MKGFRNPGRCPGLLSDGAFSAEWEILAFPDPQSQNDVLPRYMVSFAQSLQQ